VNDEDFVISLREFCTPFEKDLSIAQFKLRINKKIYDATKKFEHS